MDSMERKRVSLASCPDYERDHVEQAVERALGLLGGAESIAGPGQSVFVKSNAVLASAPGTAMVTHPEVVRAVVRQFRRVTDDVTVGDSPGGPFTPAFLKRVYEKTGLAGAARDTGAKLALDTRTVEVACPRGAVAKKLTLCRSMMEADVLVSVSKFKSHRFLNVTGPVKNLYGTVPGITKMAYHSHFEDAADFADLIVDVHLAAGAAFHLLDAVDVIEGDGSRKGTIKRMGVIAAGRDAFAVEATFLGIAGLDPGVSKPLAAAVRRGICPPGSDWFEVLGEDPGSFENGGFKLPSINLFSERALARISRRWVRLFAVTPYPLPGTCTRCGRCAEICPRGAITMGPDAAEVNLRKCIRCFCCDELCEFKAIGMRRPLPGRARQRASRTEPAGPAEP